MRENTENQAASAMEVNLQELLFHCVRKWWVIALCCMLVAVIAFGYTKLFVTPLYRAEVSVYVNNSSNDQNTDYISNSDLNASTWLVNGYMDVVKRNRVLQVAATSLHNAYTPAEIAAMLTTEQVKDTQIFQIYITHAVPSEAARIVNAIAEAVPTKGAEIIDGSSARIIDYAKAPEEPISPNSVKNALIGGLIGVAFALVILTIEFMRDTRIRDEEELLMLFDLPVLGRIPDFEQEGVTSTYEYVKKPAAKEAEK